MMMMLYNNKFLKKELAIQTSTGVQGGVAAPPPGYRDEPRLALLLAVVLVVVRRGGVVTAAGATANLALSRSIAARNTVEMQLPAPSLRGGNGPFSFS